MEHVFGRIFVSQSVGWQVGQSATATKILSNNTVFKAVEDLLLILLLRLFLFQVYIKSVCSLLHRATLEIGYSFCNCHGDIVE